MNDPLFDYSADYVNRAIMDDTWDDFKDMMYGAIAYLMEDLETRINAFHITNPNRIGDEILKQNRRWNIFVYYLLYDYEEVYMSCDEDFFDEFAMQFIEKNPQMLYFVPYNFKRKYIRRIKNEL